MPGPEEFQKKPEAAPDQSDKETSQYLAVSALGKPADKTKLADSQKLDGSARSEGEAAQPAKPAEQLSAPVREDYTAAWLRGMAGRLAYLGVTGKLSVDDGAWQNALKKAGPVGEQLLERKLALESKGWSFGKLGFNDPYWELKGQGYASRLARMTSLGGYHWDVHDGTLHSGQISEALKGFPVKRVTYNPFVITTANVMGYGYGTSDPIKNVATIMSHELGHEDGILREHPGDWKQLLPEEQKTMAKRMLATESRAIVTQLHISQQLGDTHIQNTMLRTSLRGGELGGFIHDTWGKSGGKYEAFSVLDRKEAVSFVNSYLDETFGKGLIDTKTGKIRAFDINAGFGKQIGSITGDAELAALMAENKAGVKPPASRFGTFAESAAGRTFIRGGQALAAIGTLAMVSDLRGAFQEGTAAGIGKLARVGVDWAGFEGGTALSVMAAERVAMVVPSARFAKLLPVVAMAGGFGGSWAADKYFGTKVEQSVRNSPGLISQKGLDAWNSLR